MEGFSLAPRTAAKKTSKTKKCDPATLRKAWEYFWHPVFRTKADAMVKMQWQAYKDALRTNPELKVDANKIAAAFTYIFGRYTKHCTDGGFLVPIYSLIASIPSDEAHAEKRMQLFEEMYNSPRVSGPHTKIFWKLHAETPKDFAKFGKQADIIFKQELMAAQKRAIERLNV